MTTLELFLPGNADCKTRRNRDIIPKAKVGETEKTKKKVSITVHLSQ